MARPNGFIQPCRCREAAGGLGWVHEIKHIGSRLVVRGASPLVRLFTRCGF